MFQPSPYSKDEADAIEAEIDRAIDGRIVGYVALCTCELKGTCAGCRQSKILKAH